MPWRNIYPEKKKNERTSTENLNLNIKHITKNEIISDSINLNFILTNPQKLIY